MFVRGKVKYTKIKQGKNHEQIKTANVKLY